MKDDTLLARWLAGELNANELEELQQSPKYATLLKIKDNFSKIQSPEFNQPQMLQEVLRHEKMPTRVVPLHRRLWVYSAAAVVVMLVGLGITFTRPETMAAPYGETMAFNLPDGSGVMLNAGSEASYRNWNWGSNREVKLDGEAYFKVAKGKKFTVATPAGNVTVLGTQFNVKARGNRIDVTCYEGRVKVEQGGKHAVLTPGKSITINAEATEGITGTTATDPEWLHSEIVFSRESLENVISELEREYNIRLETSLKTQQLFTGSLPGNNIDAALKIIERTYHLKAVKQNGMITLNPDNASK